MPEGYILIVEDEAHIADVVEYALAAHGFACRRAADGRGGWTLFHQSPPILVLLDLNLPGIPGLDLFADMRRAQPDVPVIMLTARTDEVDRVTGLELGADDYVTKPFSPRELVARVRAVLRRDARGTSPATRTLRAGPLALDPAGLRATIDGHPLALSRQEFTLLEALMRHPARLFSRDALIDLIHAGQACVTDRSIDALVKRIRKHADALQPGFDPIETVYGMGYKFNPRIEG